MDEIEENDPTKVADVPELDSLSPNRTDAHITYEPFDEEIGGTA